MADMFSPKQRSEIMSRVKSRENQATELRLMRVFREFGIRGWRRRASIFGSPDFIFPTARLAVFVDGCFWHGCPIHGSVPATNQMFWRRKLSRNKKRDKVVGRELNDSGWRVLRIWQHELREPDKVARRVGRLLARYSAKAGGESGQGQKNRGR
jgi:DNA mismatch endonuclease (patch repair protein)